MHSCINDRMKTITLTDEAYQRLKDWKQAKGDSFSKVVLAVVPRRGTLEQMAEDVGQLPALSSEQARVMEEAARWGRDPDGAEDPWTS
jgi:predicted CopG family antitoxin